MKKAYPITRKQKTDGNGNGSRPFLEAFFFSLFKEKLMTGFVIFIYTYADGTMLKTRKGKLMEELESRILSEKPNHVDVTITDVMFFLYLWKELPAFFHTITSLLLIKAFAQKRKNRHLEFDQSSFTFDRRL